MQVRGVVGWVLSVGALSPVAALVAMSGAACGPMPGYIDPRQQAEEANNDTPPAPPAPAPERAKAEPTDEQTADGDDVATPTPEAANEPAPPGVTYEPAPRRDPPPRYTPPRHEPPRYTPPARYEPPVPPQRAEPPARYEPPARTEPAPSQVRKVVLDEDTYYLLDASRRLCFLRHKDTMTLVDCTKIPEAQDFARAPAPEPAPAPRAPAPREPDPVPAPPARVSRPTEPVEPEPSPEPTEDGPSNDETARFEGAFIDIFCDRKSGEEVAPEQRIKDRGLAVDRYEQLETWYAGDEKAWWALTDKARKACPR